MIPQDPPTWEKIGIGAIVTGLMATLALVVRTLIKGPAALAKQNQGLVDRLIQIQLDSVKQQERFHHERMEQSEEQHAAMISHLEALMVQENKQDRQLDSIRALLRRMSMLVALQKVTDPQSVARLVDAVIGAGDSALPGYEHESSPPSG